MILSARTSLVPLWRQNGLYLELIKFRVRAGVYAFCLFQNEITQTVFWVLFFFFLFNVYTLISWGMREQSPVPLGLIRLVGFQAAVAASPGCRAGNGCGAALSQMP